MRELEISQGPQDSKEGLTPQLEGEEHSVGGEQDKAETSTHFEEIVKLGSSRYALSPGGVDDSRSHRVGIVECRRENDRCDLASKRHVGVVHREDLPRDRGARCASAHRREHTTARGIEDHQQSNSFRAPTGCY
jgi:hypothetical protein